MRKPTTTGEGTMSVTAYEETAANSDAAKDAERTARTLAYEVATLDGPYASGVDAGDIAESIADELAVTHGLALELAFEIAEDAAGETLDLIWNS
jgi:hypothetical protein